MRHFPDIVIRTGLALLVMALGGCQPAPTIVPDRPIGLSTSLPLIWREAGDIRGQLAGSDDPHWSMRILAARGRVIPLDTLASANGSLPLPGDALLVLIQPQPLMPEENVALDTWVRSGGRLLLFADPMLTTHSRYPLGDPRGPQRTAMLSPILQHWGLQLQFDADQTPGERIVDAGTFTLPVDLAGRWVAAPGARCAILASAVIADCHVGRGRVIVVGDAAVFDGDDAGRQASLAALLVRLSP